jgi:hypothetical protein
MSRLIARERSCEILRLATEAGHVDDAITEAVAFGLLVVPDLEDRIERLENLFREQAGLHYLRLAEPPPGTAPKRDSA